jgi:NAD(P)-dependent dehydrogenase (short-subunit alcohol dehydrogenase family)
VGNSPEQKSRVVLVTGATDGLGRAAAVLFAERGYRAFAGGRNAQRLAALEELAQQRKLPLVPLALDVTDEASAERAVAEIERQAGPVDILVNNAGIAIGAAAEEITIADYKKVLETNFFAIIRMAQRVLPEMRRRRCGRIINMSSISGKVAIPLMGAYSASKYALEAFSDALRLELYPFDVRVVLIEPGYIPTSMNQTASELSSAYAKNAESSPYRGVYQRFLSSWSKTRKASRYVPEDCARVVLRAAEENPPRARYVVTREAKIGVVARRLLPDRLFDRTIRKRLGLGAIRESLLREAGK